MTDLYVCERAAQCWRGNVRKSTFSYLHFHGWNKKRSIGVSRELRVSEGSVRLHVTNYTQASLKQRVIFTQQLAQLFHTHARGPQTQSVTQRDKDTDNTDAGKKSSKLFPVRDPASLYHHASQTRGVNGWCFQNTWKQTNSSEHKRHSAQGGLLPWIESKGAGLCEQLGVLFTGKDPCKAAHCGPVR